jgi:hypothetical protein
MMLSKQRLRHYFLAGLQSDSIHPDRLKYEENIFSAKAGMEVQASRRRYEFKVLIWSGYIYFLLCSELFPPLAINN